MIKNKKSKNLHKPVLLNEVLEVLQVKQVAHLHSNAQFIDATLGYGGHSNEFVKHRIFVLGIETDKAAINHAVQKLSQACPTPQETERCFQIVHDNFRNIDKIASVHKLENVLGILFDLGISSPQITSSTRGFSFQNKNAPLDMRMDTKGLSVTAADLLNSLPEKQLFELFNPYLEYRDARKLSKKIVEKRQDNKFEKIGDLLEILDQINFRTEKLHNATLPLMALRIAVNSELQTLEEALPKAFNILESTGRLAVISFHSEEDRIIKNLFKHYVEKGEAVFPTHKLIVPNEQEININPRARSAKLRVIQKK